MIGAGLTLLVLAAGAGPTEADVVAYGKRLDVHQIDARIDSERYTAWLRKTLGPGVKITWHGDDCGEGGNGNDDFPLCFEADAHLRPRGRVTLSVAVGSMEGGLGGAPVLFFGGIEGLGPREDLDGGDLSQLEAKVRAARALGESLSRMPDVARDDDTWIRRIKRLPTTRFVPGAPAELSFSGWVDSLAGERGQVKWSIDGCGPREGQGPPVDLQGDNDEWAFVYASVKEVALDVSLSVRIGTCRKGPWGKPIASLASLYDKRPGHIHIEDVPLDTLEAKLRAIRAERSEPSAK